MGCVVDDTSFIFEMSSGGRDNRMSSKISEGSPDTRTGYIADSACSGVGGSHCGRYPASPCSPQGMVQLKPVSIGAIRRFLHPMSKVHDLLQKTSLKLLIHKTRPSYRGRPSIKVNRGFDDTTQIFPSLWYEIGCTAAGSQDNSGVPGAFEAPA